MDILNTVKSALGGGDKNNDLMSVVINLVGGQKGGLDGLISQFTSIGLGDVVGSWVSTGKIFLFLRIKFKVFWVQIKLKTLHQNLVWIQTR